MQFVDALSRSGDMAIFQVIAGKEGVFTRDRSNAGGTSETRGRRSA
jgi:hypothetical protein